jgi:hypothetical protein
LFLAGGFVCRHAAAASGAPQPQASLSGLLELPAEPAPLAVKDPFRAAISAPAARQEEPAKGPELPPLLLTAVLEGPGSVAAVVNGTILRPGDAYLDMTVLEISKNRVVFQRGAGKVTLFMQEKLYNSLPLGGK